MKLSIHITKKDGTYEIEAEGLATYCVDIPSTVQTVSALVARELLYASGDEWNDMLQERCLGILKTIEQRL